jgi:uncharacterized protein (DUF1499 family)
MATGDPQRGATVIRGTDMRPHSRLAIAAAALAVIIACLAMLSGFGSRWGWWHFRTGFNLLRWSVYGAIALAVLSAAAVIHARPGGPRRGLPSAVFALIVAALVIGTALQWRARGSAAPPIHDITTDTENPPAFVAIAPLRADAPNSVEYSGPETAAQQHAAYPDIQPLRLNVPADQAFDEALDQARDMGWEIIDASAAAGRIEASDRTFWFGFRDDVVIRITPADGGSVLDIRSKSRIGRGDVGTNARRIRAYLAAVRN